MSLITKLSVLNTSKLPNQVLKTFTTTHKNQVPIISRVGCKNSQTRSRSLPCRPVNSFGLIQLLQRSVSPNPYLIRRAEISYISNKINLIKEWQKRSSKRSKASSKKNTESNSNWAVPNLKLGKLTDAFKNIFRKASETTVAPVDKFENAIPNMKMKMVPYSPGRSNAVVETTHVDLEEQERVTPKNLHSQSEDNVRPMLFCTEVDKECNIYAKTPTKNLRKSQRQCNSNIVEVICRDVDDDPEETKTKKKKYVPFQNIEEKVVEPKTLPNSSSAIVSVADICKEIDKNPSTCRTRSRPVVSYPVKKKSKEIIGKAKSLDEPEPKVKKSNYWAKPKSRGQSGLSNKQAKVEPCDPYKDSKRKLSNVSCNNPTVNLTKLSYENYSIPCEAEANLTENDIFSWYENSDNVAMESLGEFRKNQSNLKVAKRKSVLGQKKALATSHVDILNTQLLCSNLFCSSSSKQCSENLQPFQIKSYLTQPNYDLSDLSILNLIVAHDKETRKVEWERQKSNIYDLKTKAKICKPKPKLIEENAKVCDQASEVEEFTKAEDESVDKLHEEQEEESQTKATTDEKNSQIKPITFIKKDYHTVSSLENFANQRIEAKGGLCTFSTKARKGGGRRRIVYITDEEEDKSDPCKLEEIIKRAKMKQGKSLMRHTEWKAVSIKGMNNPAVQRRRIRNEREEYKELIRIRSNSREKKRPERCILHTPFDKVHTPKKQRKESVENCDCETDAIVFASSNSIGDCGCVATNTRKPPAWSNEIIDPRKKLRCVKKKCVQTEECRQQLNSLLHEMKESAEKLKKLEKLIRKNKNYNSNCDTVRNRNSEK